MYKRQRLLNASDRERNSAKKKQAAELKKAEKRKAEVDGLFAKMYEDWSAGRITEYNFNMLSEKYQNEQRELETKIRQLHETMEAAVQTAADAEKWIALLKQYVPQALRWQDPRTDSSHSFVLTICCSFQPLNDSCIIFHSFFVIMI